MRSPGQFEAFAHRKAFCEHQVRDGIGAGATQILVLGAGYDTLGWRLALQYSGVNFYEIDHPATAALKARGINAMGKRDNLFLIAEYLGKRKLVDALEPNKTLHVAKLDPEMLTASFNAHWRILNDTLEKISNEENSKRQAQ